MIKLELDINSVNFILQTLGELPTKTGAWVSRPDFTYFTGQLLG